MNLQQNIGPLRLRSMSVQACLLWGASLYAMSWGVVRALCQLIMFFDGSVIRTESTPLVIILQFASMIGLTLWIAMSRIQKSPFAFKDKQYLQYLALSPWEHGKPLPLGTCFYTPGDLLLTLGLTLLGTLQFSLLSGEDASSGWFELLVRHGKTWLILATMIDLGILTLVFMIAQLSGCKWKSYEYQLFLLLLPLPIYLHTFHYATALVCVLIYVLCACVLGRNLRQLQWQWPYWGGDAIEELRSQARQSKLIIGSMQMLAPNKPIKAMSLRTKVITGFLITWWFHAIVILGYLMDNSGRYDRDPLFLLISVVAINFGITNFARFVAMSPLHAYARPWTGRWFIARCDLILVMPILLLLTGWGMTWLFVHNKISPIFYMYTTALLMIMIHHFTSPSPESWHYTWHHSRYLGKQPEPRKQTNSTEIRFTLS